MKSQLHILELQQLCLHNNLHQLHIQLDIFQRMNQSLNQKMY